MPTVTLTGQSAVAYAGNLRISSSDWYNFFNEQQLIVDAYSNTNNQLLGIELDSYAGIFSMPSPSWYSFYYEHQQLIHANANGYNSIDGITATIDHGTIVINGTENVSVVIYGISASSSFGEISAQGQSIVNAEISLSGLSSEAYISQISAIADNPVTWSSSCEIRRYSSSQFVSATAKVSSVLAKADIGEVQTNATTVINSTISLNNVVSFTQASDINASGTLEISDEELILLLAA